MQSNILQKCIDELKKEGPDISYVVGVLETILELQGVKPVDSSPAVRPDAAKAVPVASPAANSSDPVDMGAILDRQAAATVNDVRASAEKMISSS